MSDENLLHPIRRSLRYTFFIADDDIEEMIYDDEVSNYSI